jgi:hypothetical protein
LLLLFRTTQHFRSHQGCTAENNAAPEKNSAIKNALGLTSIFHVSIRVYSSWRIESQFADERIRAAKSRLEFNAA